MILFERSQQNYPAGTQEGFYPIIGRDNAPKIWAPRELVVHDNRQFLHGLRLHIPTPDTILALAKGGLEIGQEAGYKLGKKNARGKSIAKVLCGQTRGYDDDDNPLPKTEIVFVPNAEAYEKSEIILCLDDLTDHNEAIPLVVNDTKLKAPHAIVISAVPYAKRNGAGRPDFVGSEIEDLWVVFENQSESDADHSWYMDQVLDRYDHYHDDMQGYIEARRYPLPDSVAA